MDVNDNKEFFGVLDAALFPMGRANGGRGALCGRVLGAGRWSHVRSYGRRAAISVGIWGPVTFAEDGVRPERENWRRPLP